MAANLIITLMFWTWHHLKRLYAALVVIVVAAVAAGWIAQRLGAPDWTWSAIVVIAFASWIVVAALVIIKQWLENRRGY